MRPRTALLPALLAAGTALAAAAAGATDLGAVDSALTARLARLAAPVRGTVGVCAIHVESGRTATLLGDRPFVMQSTFKTFVAAAALSAVDRGELALGTPVALRARDMSPNASRLTRLHPQGGVSPTVHELIEIMVTESDNTACDALLRELGGPARVTAWLREHGFEHVRVDRDEFALNNDWFGLDALPETTWTAASLARWREAVPSRRRTAASEAFLADPRDRATPAGYAAVLAALQQGELLSPASTDTLLAILGRCATGASRLPAMLPPQARLGHKTGTGGTWKGVTNAVNDAGLLTLPGGGGHVAIVVLVEGLRGPVAGADRVIAAIAREVFDHWNAPD